MKPDERKPTRQHDERRHTENVLAVSVVLFLTIGGSIAISLAYGSRALLLGTSCLVIGSLIFGLLWVVLTAIEHWVDS